MSDTTNPTLTWTQKAFKAVDDEIQRRHKKRNYYYPKRLRRLLIYIYHRINRGDKLA